MTKAHGTRVKALLCGRTAKITFFEKEIFYNLQSDKKKKKSQDKYPKPQGEKTDNRKRAGNRAKSSVFNLVSTNAWFWYREDNTPYLPTFLTLTIHENITDISIANYWLTKFLKRFNYYVFKTKKMVLQYLSVIEFQKRGAIHYHIILFNLPFTPSNDIQTSWGFGFIKIKKVHDEKNVAGYLTKYVTKGNDDERLQNKKRYSCSRGLKKPIVINVEEKALEIYQKLPKEYITSTYEMKHEYIGKMKMISYDFGKGVAAGDIIGEYYS